MTITINGDALTIPENITTIDQLLTHLDVQNQAIVEWNEKVLTKDIHESSILAAGDKLEIVHFVGGG